MSGMLCKDLCVALWVSAGLLWLMGCRVRKRLCVDGAAVWFRADQLEDGTMRKNLCWPLQSRFQDSWLGCGVCGCGRSSYPQGSYCLYGRAGRRRRAWLALLVFIPFSYLILSGRSRSVALGFPDHAFCCTFSLVICWHRNAGKLIWMSHGCDVETMAGASKQNSKIAKNGFTMLLYAMPGCIAGVIGLILGWTFASWWFSGGFLNESHD